MREKPKRIEPVGPDAPPTPAEVDQPGPKPMAVAADEETVHDSFKPTSAKAPGPDETP